MKRITQEEIDLIREKLVEGILPTPREIIYLIQEINCLKFEQDLDTLTIHHWQEQVRTLPQPRKELRSGELKFLKMIGGIKSGITEESIKKINIKKLRHNSAMLKYYPTQLIQKGHLWKDASGNYRILK